MLSAMVGWKLIKGAHTFDLKKIFEIIREIELLL